MSSEVLSEPEARNREAAHDLWGGRKMQSEQLRNGSSVRLGDLGMMVLQFFGGLVSVPLATILGALVIGLGGLYD